MTGSCLSAATCIVSISCLSLSSLHRLVSSGGNSAPCPLINSLWWATSSISSLLCWSSCSMELSCLPSWRLIRVAARLCSMLAASSSWECCRSSMNSLRIGRRPGMELRAWKWGKKVIMYLIIHLCTKVCWEYVHSIGNRADPNHIIYLLYHSRSHPKVTALFSSRPHFQFCNVVSC